MSKDTVDDFERGDEVANNSLFEDTFEGTSDEVMTRQDKIRRFLDLWVYAPASILWNDWRARIGILICGIYVLMGTIGVWIIEPTQSNDGPVLQSWFETLEFPLGTTYLGQDIFSLIVHSTPAMLEMILSGGIFTVVIATIVGTLTGYKGGYIDYILTVLTDIMINIPGLPLLVVLAAVIEPEQPWLVGIVLSVNAWAGLARSLRSQVLTLRELAYVEASKIMGVSTVDIIKNDLLPNLMPYILISFVNAARNVIFASVGLYFLGVLPYTNQNWGIMLNNAYQNGAVSAGFDLVFWIVSPMLAIMGLSIGLVLVSQSLDRVFNPRIRARHAKTADDKTPPD